MKGDRVRTDDAGGDHESQSQRARDECSMRRRVKEQVEDLAECLGFGSRDCAAMKKCQWGAQEHVRCGINEQQLLVSLLGKEHLEHPLVKAVLLNDECREHGDKTCEVSGQCILRSDRRTTGKVCDLHPREILQSLLARPSLVKLMDISQVGAACRARYEHGDNVCSEPCHMEWGVCRLDLNAVRPVTISKVVENLCSISGEFGECLRPCVEVGSSCVSPEHVVTSANKALMNRLKKDALNSHDIEIAEAFEAIHGATELYESVCNSKKSSLGKCRAAATTCTMEEQQLLRKNRTVHTEKTVVDKLRGMNGLLGDVFSAAKGARDYFNGDADGAAVVVNALNDIKDHPDDVNGLEEVASSMAATVEEKMPRSVRPPHEFEQPPLGPEERSIHDAEVQELQRFEHEVVDKSPWALASLSLFMCAACTGLSFGLICCSHLRSDRARTPPLLQEEYMMCSNEHSLEMQASALQQAAAAAP